MDILLTKNTKNALLEVNNKKIHKIIKNGTINLKHIQHNEYNEIVSILKKNKHISGVPAIIEIIDYYLLDTIERTQTNNSKLSTLFELYQELQKNNTIYKYDSNFQIYKKYKIDNVNIKENSIILHLSYYLSKMQYITIKLQYENRSRMSMLKESGLINTLQINSDYDRSLLKYMNIVNNIGEQYILNGYALQKKNQEPIWVNNMTVEIDKTNKIKKMYEAPIHQLITVTQKGKKLLVAPESLKRKYTNQFNNELTSNIKSCENCIKQDMCIAYKDFKDYISEFNDLYDNKVVFPVPTSALAYKCKQYTKKNTNDKNSK